MTSETVWVVDDDPIFRMIFTMTLKKSHPHKKILEYSDGSQACESFEEAIDAGEKLPEAIFMDINMPVMDGWQCMKKMQELISGLTLSKPKLYVVSSSINPDDERKAKSFPISSGYLVKPLTIEVFKQIFG